MLINIREFQLLSYLGHQLYTFLNVCYIEGEFVDIVLHRVTYYVLRNDIIQRDTLLCLGTNQVC